MSQIAYSVTPLMPVEDTRRYSELTIADQKFNFWEFLNLPFLDQMQMAAFMLLRKRGAIKERHWQETSIGFKEFNTDDICQTIEKHAIAYIEAFGEDPAAIFMGPDVHRQLLSSPRVSYLMDYQFIRRGNLSVAGIRVVLVPHLRGGFLSPDLTQADRDNL
jgi:hypothetical protein